MISPAAITENAEAMILVIGDEAAERSVVRDHLQTAGYTVYEANDVRNGIELTRRHTPDLVLLDIDPPSASYLDACRTLRAEPSLQNVPIFIRTEATDADSVAACLSNGASDLIAKPTAWPLFTHRVKTLLHDAAMARELANAGRLAQASANALADIGHEIHTPLNDLIAMIDRVQHTKNDGDRESTISKARETASSLLGTIEDILDLSAIAADAHAIDPTETPVTAIVEEAIESLLPLARDRHVELAVFASSRIPDRVLSDPARMRRILLTLVGAVIKNVAHVDGHQAKVRVDADLATSGGAVSPVIRFTVAGTGNAISNDPRARPVTQSSRRDDSMAPHLGGMDLKLSICRALADQLGGSISADSGIGSGAAFVFDLPFVPAKTDTQCEGNRMENLHILLVVQDPDLERAARDYLAHEGADITHVASVEAAEQAFAETGKGTRPFDVAVIAHTRPQAVDAENAAIAALSASPDCENTQFVLLSDDRRDRTPSVLPRCTILSKHPLSRTLFVRAVLDAAGRSDADAAPIGAPEESTTAPGATDPVGGVVLLAEDNVINQLVLQRQLEEFGYIADIAADGEEAFEAYQRGDYRLLLVDCHMPKMDGYALARAIRQIERQTGRRIPIVAVSADSQQDDVDRCLDAGMDDYLFKPVELEKLGLALKQWLGDGADTAADTAGAPD